MAPVFNAMLGDGGFRPFETVANGHVLGWTLDPAHYASGHERATRLALTRRIAQLKGFRYFGEAEGCELPEGARYFVPSDTIVGCEQARAMGIVDEADLFGGVVPFGYVATKAISHPLIGPEAVAPASWVRSFAPRIRTCVLKGYTAFSQADARRAGRRLLRDGAVRVKPVRATGGCGQSVVRDTAALDQVLADLPTLAEDGVVLERNLRTPRTLSIGQVTVGSLRASYYGLQRTTRNGQGAEVYGGSDLTVVRGGLDALRDAPMDDALRLAVEQAAAYHAAVLDCYPGVLASRINYDVAQGADERGHWCSGVLEQSWRIGGASGAEVAALEALRDDPSRQLVRASCFEVFGEVELPPGACVNFAGVDPAVGPLTKYSFVDPNADAT